MTDLITSSAPADADFLSVRFDLCSQQEWRDLLFRPAGERFDYVVTPNVDHIVRLAREPEIRPVYDAARWHICDSRILQKLARRRGLDLQVYPGSDMVADLLHDRAAKRLRIQAIGPSAEDFAKLTALYPDLDLVRVEAPFMRQGSPEWRATLEAVEAVPADIYLFCLSFPKQEFFAADLKARGIARGTGFCVGASLDFLTGHQTRAPQWMRQAGLEWAHRLLSNPRRLWKRYLIDAPKIFALYMADKRR
ncbi:WecB/TagA/CpsF family glycosyltransferase [Thioclava sp. FTW29]|uniref:WecB/TagA/CpsF family glycosyltransferase n=1 Tax=Thioclava litoralis TaxID=3076557 RepID=A0ABZ1E431_9RHOB|nr:WecB/TagA/CpsF family glycosyltransferase [Thioclava sp. FTW29]